MKKVLKAIAVVIFLAAVGMFIAIQTATVVRQLKPASELKPDGVAVKTRTADALDYSVSIAIAAPPSVVWALLTEAKAYPQWNTTIVRVEGTIAKTQTIHLTAKVAPDRVFDLKVTEFVKESTMVWEDGGKAFAGVRTFTLIPTEGGGKLYARS